MASTRLEIEFDQTAMIVAKIHNANFTPKITDLAELNPFRKAKGRGPKMTLKEKRRADQGEIVKGEA